MTEVTFNIDKESVYTEVAQTTSYTGAKMEETGAYERIFTTDADRSMLERFWNESKSTVANSLKRALVREHENDGTYTIEVALSSAFNPALTESMQQSMFSFFVMNITAKWYAFTNKEEAAGYATAAAAHIEDILRKAFFKTRPTRPTFTRLYITPSTLIFSPTGDERTQVNVASNAAWKIE